MLKEGLQARRLFDNGSSRNFIAFDRQGVVGTVFDTPSASPALLPVEIV
jgi:hypothetical protein